MTTAPRRTAPGDAAAVASPPAGAAAVPSPPASVAAILSALGLIGVGTAAAYVISRNVEPFRVGDQMTTFGILLVFAGAVERLLEPVTQRLPGRRARDDYERAIARVANGEPTATLADVAAAKARVDRARADRTVVAWGLATAVATVLCAGAGFFLLRVLENEPHWDGVARWVDALVTGLVVGSGTKPVHDLITRLQKSKDKPDDKA